VPILRRYGKQVISMQGEKSMIEKSMVKDKYSIILDLDRCIGCYACEVACKQENLNRPGTPFIRLHTIGPKRVQGKLAMEYVTRISERCSFCKGRDQGPSCAYHCPTKALRVLDAAATLETLKKGWRYQVCHMAEI
jgi:Fe-S-cluster-containing dehydrogenase component